MAMLLTLPVCCLCKRVSENPADAAPAWMDLQSFLDLHHLDHSDFQLSHTYCPSCYDRQANEWHFPATAPSAGLAPSPRRS